MATVKLTSVNFEQEVLKSDKPVLVDFWAAWCGPCQMVGPVIEEISEENKDIKVCKVDIDTAQDLAAKYGVMSIPTMVVFKDGVEVNRTLGNQPKEAILEILK